MSEFKKCPICGASASFSFNHNRDLEFYRCPVCGRYQLGEFWDERGDYNMNHLASFLAHNAFSSSDISELRYHTTVSDNICAELKKEGHGHPIHMDSETIEAWYPKTFSEKVDSILLYIYKAAPHIGQSICFTKEHLYSLLFVDRYEQSGRVWKRRSENNLQQEGAFMLSCLANKGYIEERQSIFLCDNTQDITLMPAAYSRIDEIQKHTSNSRNVLVAMKFGEDTRVLREAIRSGITNAEYHAVFIDEVQHNEFITPELLKHIKDSKFVVVDLTHQNNGAYFEEGYAMGLGKPVIQLCKKETKLHFDIAQKNTIIWEKEDEIPDLLCNRIKATIE